VNSTSPESLTVRKLRFQRGGDDAFHPSEADDLVAREEPLELRVEGRSVAVVMRTPGHDEELAAGFLATEGVIRQSADLFEMSRCPTGSDETSENLLEIFVLDPEKKPLDQLSRNVFSASSCGICGKATIESIFQSFPTVGSDTGPRVTPELLLGLPDSLRQAQETFDKTGGLHASAVFSPEGELVLLREDVGRHNALDKVVGHALLNGLLPLENHLLLVSGRISFELIQKALAARIPIVAGISAPSSLAVEFAEASGQTLVGFLRPRGFNAYANQHRIVASSAVKSSQPSRR